MLNRHRRGQSGEPLKKAQPALQPRVRVAIDWELRRQGAARVWGKQPQALSTAPGGPSCVALLSSDISVYRAPVLANRLHRVSFDSQNDPWSRSIIPIV